jgi:hypothetical protein
VSGKRISAGCRRLLRILEQTLAAAGIVIRGSRGTSGLFERAVSKS